ncbi:ATPase [Cohnella kolymensis]|uniref:ATPase n=2 Tax=Cohnella kolymensis TaxID=1590652 RepID=A0ABR5A8C8_9BACL|nr:ATPase [Cohnella kolymensis]
MPMSRVSFSFAKEGGHEENSYFQFARALDRVRKLVVEKLQSEVGLYSQNDGNDVWEWVQEDVRRDFRGAHRFAVIYELLEQKTIEFQEAKGDSAFEIYPLLHNNVIGYPEYGVAFARIPIRNQYGIGNEDIIFARNDEAFRVFLADLQERQLRERRITVFTDTKEGLERSREELSRAVQRDDVVMEEALKTQIFRSIDEFFLKDRVFFQTYDIPYKRGVLLYGKPGNGKTTLVKSITGSVEAPVAYWQITEHTTSDSIQEVFSAAIKMAPMILVIEDIDSMPDSARSYFLNTLDGATSREGIFLIGTTNYPEKIDPALINRAGRFDRAYEVKQPDERLRVHYLTRKGLQRIVSPEVVEEAARRTEGFSFAQLNELFVSAALQKHYEDQVDLERLIDDLKIDLKKGSKRVWLTDKSDSQVGFLVR